MNPVRKVAVIDIGSNSCRMVIYEQAGSALLPYFNEKTMAGLGRDLPKTGQLSKTGRAIALRTFHRFRAITETLGIEDVYPVATAAVREASDGADFRAVAEEILGVPIQVLSGSDEGRISAHGVKLGFAEPMGLVADLGGTSMELRYTAESRSGETFLLGPLAGVNDPDKPLDKRRKLIRRMLETSELLEAKQKHIFAVGGAWRNVAAVHMRLTGYPLHVVHGYRMDASDVETVVDAALQAEVDDQMRTKLQAVSKRRYDTLLHAALVLQELIKVARCKTVHISAYGLRDGVISETLEFEAFEPLLDTVPLFLRSTPEAVTFGRELFRFARPVLDEIELSEGVMQAICLMADAGARMHPDHRPNLVFDQIIRAPVPALTHQERIFAAYACASRYTFKFIAPMRLGELLPERHIKQAKLFGTIMRLGAVYSGRSAAILKTARLERDGTDLVLRVDPEYADLVSETVEHRLDQLAGLMKLAPCLETRSG